MSRPASESIRCSHRPPCPGCPRFGESGVGSATAERLARLAARYSLPQPHIVEGAAEGFRHRARLSVRGRARSPKIGLFQQGSHRIVDTPNCVVHHPAINRVAAGVKRAIRATGVAPYADRPHKGLVRGIQAVVERSSQRVQLVLIENVDDAAASHPLLTAIERELDGELHSLWWNGNPERSNTILGAHWQHISGAAMVEERIGGASVFFPPAAFGQANLPLADRMVAQIASWLEPGRRVAELYAGCGAIGLGQVARVNEFVFNERSSAGLSGLAKGVEALDPELGSRVRILEGAAGECAPRLGEVDVLIVDPPRRGLDRELLEVLGRAPAEELIYVSCSIESLERDLDELESCYVPRDLTGYALFPYTDHVETIVRCRRREARSAR